MAKQAAGIVKRYIANAPYVTEISLSRGEPHICRANTLHEAVRPRPRNNSHHTRTIRLTLAVRKLAEDDGDRLGSLARHTSRKTWYGRKRLTKGIKKDPTACPGVKSNVSARNARRFS